MDDRTLRAALAEAQKLLSEGRIDEAESHLDALRAQGADEGFVCEGLAHVELARGNIPAAADRMTQASVLLPKALNVVYQAGHLSHLAGRFDEALALIDRALTLSPLNPTLFYARGLTLGALGRIDDEIAAYRKALDIKDDFVDAYVNLGVALREAGRFDEALAAFKTAIGLNPDHAGARTNRAQTNLLLGNFEHGWRDYEWRWLDGRQRHGIEGRRWDGNLVALRGKTLLVHAEQGLGDTIQFVRYLDRLAGCGVHLILRVQPELVTLLKGYPGVAVVTGDDSPVPSFDFHIPLLSLPSALYRKFPDIPVRIPYLAADPGLAQSWNYRLEERGIGKDRKRIGLVWSTSRRYGNDQDLRQTRLAQWLTLLEVNAYFVSLQKVVLDDDRETLDAHPAIYDPSASLDSLADTAALASQLDLVISIDTVALHVAGALGLPVWIALLNRADWRWGLDREDSPWYPTARLFRESRPDDMKGVIARIQSALSEFCG